MQWSAPHPEPTQPYVAPNQPPGIMPAVTSSTNLGDAQPGAHDPAMLQAAQLLLPTDYNAPPRPYHPSKIIFQD